MDVVVVMIMVISRWGLYLYCGWRYCSCFKFLLHNLPILAIIYGYWCYCRL